MRQITKKDYQKTIRDRWWVVLSILNVLLAIIVILILGFSISPKETQVITHFSSFSSVGFYRSYWYYLWGYVLLEMVVVGVHCALSLKLHQLQRRDLSLALLWATLGISVMVLLFGLSIIKIAAIG